MGKNRNSYILVAKLKGRNNLEDPGIGLDRIVLPKV
jgi:hypothetical protein